ncbi:MAG TPA: alpha/beta hydrolase, partial [Aldersonia sp.]
LAEAVDQLAERHSPNRSVLIGHSIGGMLALRVASETRVPLAGVEVSGLGERWQPGLREMWASLIGDAPEVSVPAEAHAQVMFGPAGTFDSEQITRDRDLLRPMPMPELVDVVDWSHALPSVAARIDVSVGLTLAEHDGIWQSDLESRSALAARFTACPSVRIDLFPGAGHCIELHRGARAYCLRQLAFVEEALEASAKVSLA